MITKEQMQAILNVVPDGFTIEIRTKGTDIQMLQSIYFDRDKKLCTLFFADDLNS